MEGFSEHITDVLVNSWRPATQKQYTAYIKKWAIFCGTRKITPFSPDLSIVLQFLYTLHSTARSALSCIVMIDKKPRRPTPSCLSFPQRCLSTKTPCS